MPELRPALSRRRAEARGVLDDGRTISAAAAAGEVDSGAACRPAPAHGQAVHLRLQRRRRRARRRGTGGRAGRQSSPRPRPSCSAPRSKPSWPASNPTTPASCSPATARTSPAWSSSCGSASTPSGLQTFLTAGPKEARAWTIHIGDTAPEAAGVIHTDFQRGFIKAEIVGYDDLVAAGSVARGPGRRQGPHRGQGLRHARRRRRRVPLQHLTTLRRARRGPPRRQDSGSGCAAG